MRPFAVAQITAVTAVTAGLAFVAAHAGGSSEPVPAPQRATTVHSARWGYTVRLPPGWERAEGQETSLSEPREILTAGTLPLRFRPTRCAAFAGGARADLGPADAFVTVLERGYDRAPEWRDFPPRPARLGSTSATLREAEPLCGDRPGSEVHWLNFTDGGRHFHVLAVVGPDAPGSVRDDLWRLLDALRVDPSVEPDWPSSG